MKFILLLTVLLFNSALFAKELTVLVLDGWKSKPIANCEVTLESVVGKVLFVVETDAQGKVVFSDLSYGKYTVVTTVIGNDFNGAEYEVKLKDDEKVTLVLRPSRAYQSQQRAMEDSIYGEFDPLKKSDEESDQSEDTLTIQAIFPGGSMEMKRFIQENVMYPEISRELGDQGRVYVIFIVEPDGVVSHVSMFRGLTEELDEEAMRLVRAMPAWTPAMVEDKKVRSICRLPITYTLT